MLPFAHTHRHLGEREKETEEWLQNDNEKLKMSTFDQKEDDNKRTSEWTNEWTMWMNAEKEWEWESV